MTKERSTCSNTRKRNGWFSGDALPQSVLWQILHKSANNPRKTFRYPLYKIPPVCNWKSLLSPLFALRNKKTIVQDILHISSLHLYKLKSKHWIYPQIEMSYSRWCPNLYKLNSKYWTCLKIDVSYLNTIIIQTPTSLSILLKQTLLVLLGYHFKD